MTETIRFLGDPSDPAWLVRYARGLIDHARHQPDERVRDSILSEAAGAISTAERLMPKDRPRVVIMAEVA